ncbi:replication initiation factor domain-containing protein [Campylobacter jejuni]
MGEKVKSASSPPSGNTGAQNTYRDGLRALVDWVSATFSDSTPPEKLADVLGIPFSLFVQMDRGNFGYRKQYRFGHIAIYYDGNPGMGIHVELSGQGCREFEKLSRTGWDYLFQYIRLYGHFTRLDVAVDDFKGYFTIGRVVDYVRKGLCSSKFKKAITIESNLIADGSSTGQTVYFGSPSSRIKVRFYDKLNERLQAGKDIEDGIDFWNRTEIELRDERADLMAEEILNAECLGDTITAVLKNYINFKMRGTDSNKSRWKDAKWWQDFLGNVEKLHLTHIAPDRTVTRIKNWIDKQTPRSLAVLFRALGEDYYYIQTLIEKGLEQLTEEDDAIITAYLEMKQERELNEDMFYAFIEKNKKPTDQDDQWTNPFADGM